MAHCVPLRHVVHEKESLGGFHGVQSLFTKLFLSRCERKVEEDQHDCLGRHGQVWYCVVGKGGRVATCVEEGQAICGERWAARPILDV